MHKRGQFFLIAALIIIGIIMSFGTIYTVTSASKHDSSFSALAQEIKYEAVQLIAADKAQGKDDTAITNDLTTLMNVYVSSHPNIQLFTVQGQQGSITKKEYNNNKGITFSVKEQGDTIVATLDTHTYTFDNHKVFNFYIFIRKEVNDETSIASA